MGNFVDNHGAVFGGKRAFNLRSIPFGQFELSVPKRQRGAGISSDVAVNRRLGSIAERDRAGVTDAHVADQVVLSAVQSERALVGFHRVGSAAFAGDRGRSRQVAVKFNLCGARNVDANGFATFCSGSQIGISRYLKNHIVG